MASDDLRLQLVIQAILDAKGFDEAKASLTGLAATANTAAPSMKVLANETENVAIQQEVSSREIKILTREMLSSIGASEGAGAAGRLAAVGFSAIGNSAMMANLALTAVGFGLAFLLPRIIEWVNDTGEATKAQNELLASLTDFESRIKGITVNIAESDTQLQKWVHSLHEAALAKEANELKELEEKWYKLAETIDEDGLPAHSKMRTELEGLSAQMGIYRRAQEANMTIAEMDTKATKEHAKAIKDDAEAQKKAHEAAIKHMDFFADQEATRNRIYLEEQEDRNRALDFKQKQEKDALADMHKGTVFTKQQLAERRKAEDEYAKSLKRASDEEQQWAADDQKFQEQMTQAEIGYIGATLDALGGAFGNNKALRIAGAIADTWAGASAALAEVPWPANIAAAASVAAVGLAQVANIEKASPGFDDPMNDIIAEKLGRKSASDFVRLFGGGFHDGLRAANTGGGSVVNTTINRGVSVQSLHMSGILGVNEQDVMKNLNRKLISAQRLETRTTLGRS